MGFSPGAFRGSDLQVRHKARPNHLSFRTQRPGFFLRTFVVRRFTPRNEGVAERGICFFFPFPLIVILPTNKRLLDPSLDKDSELAEQILQRWAIWR
jgi:hypothetical protein